MEAHIIAQGKNDPPQFDPPQKFVLDMTNIPEMTFCVCEGGMVSGEPSVIMAVEGAEEVVFTQTSLDKFLMAASGMVALAQQNWNWVRPEGYATIMPGLTPEKRKELLESIKKELEEWDDTTGQDPNDSGTTD